MNDHPIPAPPYRPTDAEYLWMSQLVYVELTPGYDLCAYANGPAHLDAEKNRHQAARHLAERGWTVLLTSDPCGQNNDCGYFGAVFHNPVQGHAVFAHRGTDQLVPSVWFTTTAGDAILDILTGKFDTRRFTTDAIADAQVALKALPDQFCRSAKQFIQTALPVLVARGGAISFTGHSLGGALAELSVAWLNRPDGDRPLPVSDYLPTRAVTFDSPGTRDMIEHEIFHCPADLDITGYVRTPNLVNTLNEHAGCLIAVDPDWKAFVKSQCDRVVYVTGVWAGWMQPPAANLMLTLRRLGLSAGIAAVLKAGEFWPRWLEIRASPLRFIAFLGDIDRYHSLAYIGGNVFRDGGSFPGDLPPVNDTWPKDLYELSVTFGDAASAR